MEKINSGLKFILLLDAVLAFLGKVEIQSYKTIDADLRRTMEEKRRQQGNQLSGIFELPERTHYRVVLKF